MPRPAVNVSSRSVPPPVLVLCADESLSGALVRELAGRHYQPLVDRPGWTWQSLLEWARPVAAVVDAAHPAARSTRFLAASDDLDVGLVVVGDPAETGPAFGPRHSGATAVPVADARVIGGAVDAAVRRRPG